MENPVSPNALIMLARIAIVVGLLASVSQADPPKKVTGPIVGKPVKPSVSPPLSELIKRKKEREKKELANRSDARKALDAHLGGIRGAKFGQTIEIKSAALKSAFPKTTFFLLRFPQFPVARAVPKPLGSNNVYAVAGKSVTHIKTAAALGKYFQTNLSSTSSQKAAKTAAEGFITLSRELASDGFYRFVEIKVATTSGKGGPVAEAVAKVNEQRGDRGSITVRMSFLEGKLESVTPGGKLSPGVRPRCQATRLLHKDPVIREIMRRDLIVMGSVARDYLADQWQKASPELRREMESVWAQIVAEGR